MAAIINLRHQNQQRRSAFLEAQLQKVYAPIYWLLHKSQRMDKLLDRYDEAATLVAAAMEAQAAKERYDPSVIRRAVYLEVRRSLIEIQSTLDQNPLYIDVDDIPLFLALYEATARINVELGETAEPSRGAHAITLAVGDFDLVDSTIVTRIAERFHAKRDAYVAMLYAKRN